MIVYLHVLFIFRRHLLETEGHEQLLASCSSPDLIEAAGIVVTVQDVNCKGSHTVEPGDKEGSFFGTETVEGQAVHTVEPGGKEGSFSGAQAVEEQPSSGTYVSMSARSYIRISFRVGGAPRKVSSL